MHSTHLEKETEEHKENLSGSWHTSPVIFFIFPLLVSRKWCRQVLIHLYAIIKKWRLYL